MKCPVCGAEAVEGKCGNCDKTIVESYFKLIETEQVNRNYEKAAEYLEIIKTISTDPEVLDDVERIIKGIEFGKYELSEQKKSKKVVINKGRFFSFVVLIAIIAALVFVLIVKEQEKAATKKNEKTEPVVSITASAIMPTVIGDAYNSMANYTEGVFERDVNNDGTNEIVAVFNYNYYIFMKQYGGRLAYWYDLKNNVKIAGADKENKIIYDDGLPHDGLNEKVFGEKTELIFNAPSEYSTTGNAITFINGGFKKEITCMPYGLLIKYSVPEKTLETEIINEVFPDYYKIMEKGWDIVSVETKDKSLILKNLESAYTIEMTATEGVNIEFRNDTEKKNVIFRTSDKNFEIGIAKVE